MIHFPFRKQWIVLGLLCLLLTGSNGHAQAKSFILLPNWRQGDKVQYEMIKTRQRSSEKLNFKVKTKIKVEIEVLSATDEMHVLSWLQSEPKIEEPQVADEPFLHDVSNLLKDYRMILELDSNCEIIGVQNWQEIQKLYMKAIETIFERMKADGEDPDLISRIQAATSLSFSSREFFENYWCKREAGLFFKVLGIEFKAEKCVKYEDMLPNPLGGKPFPRRGQFELVDIDKIQGLAKATWHQVADTSAAYEPNKGKDPQKPGLIISTNEDNAEFLIEISTGWIEELKHRKTSKVEGTTHDDHTEENIIEVKRIRK